MSIHPVRRTFRLVFWPLSRPLAAGLLWSHRHTIGLWVRSFKTEITEQYEGSFSASRLRLLTTALWRVSSDPKFRNDPTVRRLTIDSELAVVDREERVASLEETLADLPGVVTAEIDGTIDGNIDPVVIGTAVPDTTTNSVTDRLITPSR
jgi:hypothetical protein